MTKTIYLTFDGQVFRPDEPVDLEPRTRVRATIEMAEPRSDRGGTFFSTAKPLDLDGPPDWSSRFEDYHYGSSEHGA